MRRRIPVHDVLIIGAGPAGLAAAIACREWELNVLVIDEFPQPGGRLLGQLHQEPSGRWWNGIDEARNLLDKANDLDTKIRCGVSAYHIEKVDHGFKVHTNQGVFEATNLLIATGAAESAVPIPGWTLPGVISIGAAQVMTNVYRVRVGHKGIIVGVNVLSVAIARELQLAGVEVHSMALPALNLVNEEHGHPKKVMDRLLPIAHLAPSAWVRLGRYFARGTWARNLAVRFYPRQGVKIWGIPIHLRKAVTKINGNDQVESVTVCDITPDGDLIPGTEQTISVDFVCIAGGLYPLAELAAVLGCPFRYIEELGGYVPVHNEQMETPLDGLFVAGNITGIENAKVARAQGTLAGLSIVKRMGQVTGELEEMIDDAKERVQREREEAIIQFHPGIQQGRIKMEAVYKKICTT